MNTAPWEPFPVDVLPGVVGRFVATAAKAIGCDASYVALPLLSALAAAIGNSRRIRLKHGWTEPAVIWTAIVGESGTLKSPAADAPLKAVRDKQARALRDYQRKVAEYERALANYQADLADWKQKDRKAGKPMPTPPEPPVCERFWCSDTTVEALAERLSKAPKGLLLSRDELAGWVRGFNQYKGGKGGAAAHWLTMHGARDLLVDRKTGDKTTIFVPRAAVSVTGGIQPGILKLALEREHFEDGLAARLLLAMPPRRLKRWSETEIAPALEDELAAVFERLWVMELGRDANGEPCPVTLPLSDDGKGEWIAFYNRHAAEQIEIVGDLAAAWSKLEGYAARLALVIRLTRWAVGEHAITPANTVDEFDIQAGITLSRWFGQEAKRVYAVLHESGAEHEQRQLAELIEPKGGQITIRELMRASRKYRTADAAEQALQGLVDTGRAVAEPVGPGPQGGPPHVLYRLADIADSADADTTPENPEETEVVSTVGAESNPEELLEWTA